MASVANVKASVEAVREQVQSLVTRSRSGTARVRLARVLKPQACWRITARIAGPHRRARVLRFATREIELNDDRIVLPEPDILTIISVGVKGDRLTLCLVEAKRVLREADEATDQANTVLRLAAKTLEQLNEPARQIAATRALRLQRDRALLESGTR